MPGMWLKESRTRGMDKGYESESHWHTRQKLRKGQVKEMVQLAKKKDHNNADMQTERNQS